MQNKIVVWIALIFWMGVIFFLSSLSSLPSPQDPWLNILLKKVAHMTVYAVLYGLWLKALDKTRFERHSYRTALILSVLYALSDEWHQSYVVLRHPSIADVIVDITGMLLAYLYLSVRNNKHIK